MSRTGAVSIATKLTRMNMFVSTTALLLACAGFLAYDLASFRVSMVRNLSMEAQVAGSNSVSALLFDDKAAAEKTLAAFRLAPEVVSTCIYDGSGKPFASYQRDANARIPGNVQRLAEQEESYWFQGGTLMLLRPILFQGKRVGFVFIQSDMPTLVARVERYALIAAAMLAVSMALALFLSHFARRAIAEPVVRLAAVARTVSRDKNYAIRSARGGEEGELADLVETFNEMLEQIEERDRSLQAAHDELERRVEERTAEWTAANRELESFSYSVSHDLRSPLRGIDGFGQALAEDYGHKLDATANSYIQRIRTATQRMGLLIDDLLNLSRVTRAQMQRQTVDLSGMAQSIAAELARRDGARKVEWVISSGIQAYGDQRLLHVVLDNLLGNAWKYTSKHERARIEFGRQGTNGSVAYFVRDDGAGFNPEYSERLFGAFQRLHGAAEFPGTGIGLATVQRIILRHGGRVWAEGAVERGATFYFTL